MYNLNYFFSNSGDKSSPKCHFTHLDGLPPAGWSAKWREKINKKYKYREQPLYTKFKYCQ